MLLQTLLVVACGGESTAAPAAPSSRTNATRGAGAPAAVASAGRSAGPDGSDTVGRSTAGAAATDAAGSAAPATDPRPAFEPGMGSDRNRAEPGALCTRLTELRCAGERHCCDAARSLDACKAAVMMDCVGTSLDDVARDAASGFDAQHAEAMLTKLEELSSRCDPSVKPWFSGPDGLRSMFLGTIAPDQTCTPPRSATVATYGTALASCTDSANHACLFGGFGPPSPPLTATCAARAGKGAQCFVDTNCQEALYCDNAAMTYSGGTCTQRKGSGASCQHSVECASGFCNHTSATCTEPNVQQAFCL